MTLEYSKVINTVIERLRNAHNLSIAKIRGRFFQMECNFFQKHITNKKVLVAGSGLGHDSFELAKYNKEVVGIEIIEKYVKISREEAEKRDLNNIVFKKGDFTELEYSDNYFDAAVLNMGTISNFDDKSKVIKELLRVSKKVYVDFYPPTENGLKKRQKMYEEEKWINVRIEGTKIVSDDGLDSISISKDEMLKIIQSIGGKVTFHEICDFALLAEIEDF
ncbi:MAG: class I SAM-dependent methyltransferase [Candidatus Aenigmatarchaeota archaeon]